MIFDKDATAIQQRIVFSVNGAAAIGHPQAKKEKENYLDQHLTFYFKTNVK